MSNPTYASFMKDVDVALIRKCGLGVNDLADFCYADAFADERDPAEVAEDVLIENNFFN